MIFQEDSQKELLERNKRREGPIFEGDESLIWSNSIDEELLSAPNLSKLINYKSILKGENIRNIYLNSYLRLQDYYLNSNYFVDPNMSSDLYQNYLFLMLSMNGHHGLFKTNQKHYFNPLTKIFEPIYYDGDFNLNTEINKNNNFERIISNFSLDYSYPYLNKLEDNFFVKEIEKIFESKVKKYDSSKKRFFKNSISQIISNQKTLQSIIKSKNKNKKNPKNNTNSHNDRLVFIEKNKDHKKNLFFIISYKVIGNKVLLTDNFGNEYKLSLLDFSKILNRKKFSDKSFIFFPEKDSISKKPELSKTSIPLIDVNILHPPETKPLINFENKVISLNNVPSKYPILIIGGALNNWKIKYSGLNEIN